MLYALEHLTTEPQNTWKKTDRAEEKKIIEIIIFNNNRKFNTSLSIIDITKQKISKKIEDLNNSIN